MVALSQLGLLFYDCHQQIFTKWTQILTPDSLFSLKKMYMTHEKYSHDMVVRLKASSFGFF